MSLFTFKAGKCQKNGNMIEPEQGLGQLELRADPEDGFVHLIYTRQQAQELDLVLVPFDMEFKAIVNTHNELVV
jgi:hypothetical protein